MSWARLVEEGFEEMLMPVRGDTSIKSSEAWVGNDIHIDRCPSQEGNGQYKENSPGSTTTHRKIRREGKEMEEEIICRAQAIEQLALQH